MRIVIGNDAFPTKKALTEHVKRILHGYEPGESLDEVDYRFMLALLQRHTEAADKIGCGVVAIEVRDALFGTRCFWLLREDGTETDFSYLNCINGKGPSSDFYNALRMEVREQTLALKATAFAGVERASCPITGESFTREEAHVDHAAPDTFECLVGRFITQEGIDPEAVDVTGSGDGETLASLHDRRLAERWRDFHRLHARLRVVSKRANLSSLRKRNAQ